MRPDQGVVGAGKERWVRAGRQKPPFSRMGWPALGWMAGQMVNGQLLTTVKRKGC